MGILALFTSLVLTLLSPCACLRLHSFIDSHMVLQREPLKARVWGWAGSGMNVTLALNDSPAIAFAVANNDGGLWTIEVPPQPASWGHTITISDGVSKITLQDIAFGDVYLCSGQSNMEMSVPGVFDANSEIHDSANYPDLRLATVSKVIAKTPQQDVTSKSKYTWARSNPEAFGNATFSYFSATCFFFGRDLYTSLNGKIPIGLIVSCWGGQKVETFSSPDALADESCGGTVDKYSQTEEGISLESSFPNVVMDQPDDGFSNLDINIEPADLWNGMIHPLLPMRLAGALWYQGESNADNATSYACRFPAMISDWRVKFDLPDLSFFYVELAAYHPGSTWANVRAAQKAALKLDKVSFATAIDLGDPPSPDGAIHPRRKQEVGRRLSLSARAIQYEEAVVFQGPLPTSFHNSTTRGGDKTLTLNFDPDTSKGLHLHGSANCTTCCSDSMAFEVLDTSGTWTKVLGLSVQRPNKVILEIPVAQSTKILGVRYAWEPYPQCILYNGVGGPDDHQALAAAPFEICVNPSGQGSWTGRGCKTTDISNSR